MLMAETAAQLMTEIGDRKFCWSEWGGGGNHKLKDFRIN